MRLVPQQGLYDCTTLVASVLCRHAVFEGDERGLWLATRTEPERDSWIERLHIAGFECLRIQLQSLREQLKARTGYDPIEFGGLAVDGVGTTDSVSGRNMLLIIFMY